jgi:choline kinase
MKAVILSAGQGRRLLPLTADTPKCALTVGGRSILEWQLRELARCGIRRVTVVVGFGAERVERLLAEQRAGTHTLYNPFYAVADNLASCWVAREEMDEDFVLLNGDTLFDAPALQRLLASPARPVTVAVDHKDHYDADDMKVQLDGDRLTRIGKDIAPAATDAESIGLLLFRREGPALFRRAVEQALRDPAALRQWYLSVVDGLARQGQVFARSIHGAQWTEVDCAADLAAADAMASLWAQAPTELASVLEA